MIPSGIWLIANAPTIVRMVAAFHCGSTAKTRARRSAVVTSRRTKEITITAAVTIVAAIRSGDAGEMPSIGPTT